MLAGLRLRADARLLAVDLGELGGELAGLATAGQLGCDAPVLLGGEGIDLTLAVDHQADRHALHASRREAAPDLAADQRAQLVADQPIDHAARLLRIDEVQVDRSRMSEGSLDGRLRDLAERHPTHVLVVEPGVIGDVPGDRLALAVEVGGEPHRLGLAGLVGELLELLAALLERLVVGREVMLEVDPQLLLREVADVAVRGGDGVSGSKVSLDRLCFGGRFDDHQVAAGTLLGGHR